MAAARGAPSSAAWVRKGPVGFRDRPEQRALCLAQQLQPMHQRPRRPAFHRQLRRLILAGGLGLHEPDPDQALGREIIRANILDVQA